MWVFIVALFFFGVLCCGSGPPAAATSSEAYAQLRLLVEALYEIDQKYVTEKQDRDLIYGAIRGMVSSLDANSSFLSPSEYQEIQAGVKQPEASAGMELSIKDNILTVVSPIEGGPAWRTGIKAGDHILKINNQTTRNLTPLEAVKKLQGPPGTKVKLQLIRNGFVKPLDFELTLEKLAVPWVAHYQLEEGYHYLRLRSPQEGAAAELQQILRSIQANASPKKGLILDLRNTAGGRPDDARRIASSFLGNDVIYIVKGRHSEQKQIVKGLKECLVLKNKLPLVILVDHGTAQAAEVVTGALQAQWGALLLGYKTFGECGVVQTFPLKDGSALVINVAFCYTPKDLLIQGRGLEPDLPGPKKDPEEQPVREDSKDQEKPRNLPDVHEIMQDPLVHQALFQLKNWGSGRAIQSPGERSLKKNQAACFHSEEQEITKISILGDQEHSLFQA